MKILIVHDTQSMQMFVTRALRQLDEVKEVTRTDSTEGALSLLREESFDLVLSDWNLGYGERSGFELLQAIREDDDQLRFGFITAEVAEDVRRLALSSGAEFVLNKPFKLHELAAALRNEQLAHLQDVIEDDPFEKTIAVGSPSTDRSQQIADLLARLCSAEVEVKPLRKGLDPRVPRYVGHYCDELGELTATCELEIRAAASIAASMHRWTPKVTEEWLRSGTLPDLLLDHLHEALNVLSRMVRADGSRSILCQVEPYAPSEPFRLPSGATTASVEQFGLEVRGFASSNFAFTTLLPARATTS